MMPPVEALARARSVQQAWGEQPVAQRLRPVARLRELLVAQIDAHVERVAKATGKPHVEALAGDLLTCIDFAHYLEQHAEQALCPEPRPGGLLFGLSKFHVEYGPLGAVAVFSPWNYPLQLSLIPTLTALVAGNAVLLKPSELTPDVGQLVGELCQQAGFPAHLVQVLQGGPELGQALVAAGPDKIFFTGSVATGRKVMRAAAERLIPLELELGGKDPMIVFADAHLKRAARGAAYGGLVNAGQACVSVERIYVERSVHDAFLEQLGTEVGKLRVGSGMEADLGPIISEAQVAIIEAQVQDALDRGAKLVGTWEHRGRQMAPVILADVTHEMRVMQDETFGPVLPVMAFEDEAHAVQLANDSRYGLGASVWTRDLERGGRVASQLVCGSCAINDVIKNISNPHLPFGGERQSGFGRYHGPEGLRAFSRVRAVMVNGGRLGREVNWFPHGRSTYTALRALIVARYGGGGAAARARQVLGGVLRWGRDGAE